MEVKKAYNADIEHLRPTAFLLGLILSLALLLVALEFTTGGASSSDDDSDELDDMAQDLSQLPLMEQKDMIAAVAAPPSSKSVTEKLNEVEKTVAPEAVDKLNLDIKSDATGTQMPDPTKDEKVSNETTAQSPVAIDENNEENFRIVEQLPSFPGGMVEFMKWLTKNLQYPPTAQAQKIQGQVIVQFIVGKDGTISGQKIIKHADPSLDREALRVIGIMPKWTPGQQNGKPCRTLFEIPINFNL